MRMENEPLQEHKRNVSVDRRKQTFKENGEKMNLFLRKLHGQWYFGTQIVETHYVENFSILKIKKNLI